MVGGLAGHLAYQIFTVSSALEEPESPQAPVPLLEHYARAAWIDAPLDGEVNTGIRTKGEGIASEGVLSLAKRARTELAEQQSNLAGRSGDQAVFMPQTGWALRLDDFLVTRMWELAVHMDKATIARPDGQREHRRRRGRVGGRPRPSARPGTASYVNNLAEL